MFFFLFFRRSSGSKSEGEREKIYGIRATQSFRVFTLVNFAFFSFLLCSFPRKSCFLSLFLLSPRSIWHHRLWFSCFPLCHHHKIHLYSMWVTKRRKISSEAKNNIFICLHFLLFLFYEREKLFLPSTIVVGVCVCKAESTWSYECVGEWKFCIEGKTFSHFLFSSDFLQQQWKLHLNYAQGFFSDFLL